LSVPTFRLVAGFQNSRTRIFTIVITGFNTDIEHDGVVYHVQTEDKGLDSPLILSLVYSGGAILASKRTRYEDLIAAGFDEEVLTERLKRQHRLICAAINAGRLEELKRMGAPVQREEEADDTLEVVAPTTQPVEVNEADHIPTTEASASDVEGVVESSVVDDAPPTSDVTAEERAMLNDGERAASEESAYTVYDPRRQAPADEVIAPETGVALTMLDDEEFRAGEAFTIRVLLEDRSGKKVKPLGGVTISLKILGSAFRPQIHSVKTERDGVATVATTMPSFSSGRAAILIRAVVKGETVELRRVIHPAEGPAR
jgi:hypothetical protein